MAKTPMCVVGALAIVGALAGCGDDGEVTYTCGDLMVCCAKVSSAEQESLCHEKWVDAITTHSSCDASVKGFKQEGVC